MTPEADARGARTIGAALAGRTNSLNTFRLVLASLVIVNHCLPLGGFSPGIPYLGELAVGGFFVISGYLITQSRLRLPLRDYLWRRATRILPAYWVVLVVTAAVFAPLAAALADETLSTRAAARYVWINSLLKVGQAGIAETLRSVPYPFGWNGSLWTLFYEMLCYLAVGALLTLPWARRRVLGCAVALLVLLTAATVWGAHAGAGIEFMRPVKLGAYFAAGMLGYAVRDRVPVHAGLAVASLAVLVAQGVWGWPEPLTAVPLAYALLAGGLLVHSGVGARNDISYGVYIYAFPIQQLGAVVGVHRAGYAVYLAASLAVTVALAWVSWLLVERPAIRSRPPWRRLDTATAPAG